MATKLEKTIRREIELEGQPFTVTISPIGVKITQKGYRKGREITWKDLRDASAEESEGSRDASADVAES